MPSKKTHEERISSLEKSVQELHTAAEKMQLQQENMLDLFSSLVGEAMHFASHQAEVWDKIADLTDGMLPD